MTLREAKVLEVSSSLVKNLQDAWQESKLLFLKAVTIVPYKLNLYKKGDYFPQHLDTPETNLIATMVVSLHCDYVQNVTTALIVRDKHWIVRENSYGFRLPWCAFFTDVVHEAPESQANRATLTFKVFWNPSNPSEEGKCKDSQEK